MSVEYRKLSTWDFWNCFLLNKARINQTFLANQFLFSQIFTFEILMNVTNMCPNFALSVLNPNYHPLPENRGFSRTEPPLDLRPVCKLKFVSCGPGEKNQSGLSISVEAWRPDEVQ